MGLLAVFGLVTKKDVDTLMSVNNADLTTVLDKTAAKQRSTSARSTAKANRSNATRQETESKHAAAVRIAEEAKAKGLEKAEKIKADADRLARDAIKLEQLLKKFGRNSE